jgi:hypothetical protein
MRGHPWSGRSVPDGQSLSTQPFTTVVTALWAQSTAGPTPAGPVSRPEAYPRGGGLQNKCGA